MNELGDQLREEVQRIIDEPMPEPSSEPIRLESEGVFNSEPFDSAGYPFPLGELSEFLNNPMMGFAKMLGQFSESMSRPRIPEPIKTEHRVKIFRFNDQTNLGEVASKIEAILNEGYCCHMPAVCGDFLIMDFSRRKETKEQ
jgi:hypothetical protein